MAGGANGEEAMAERLAGKVVVVTGGARGIGATFCRALASEGAAVVVADILDGAAVVSGIEGTGGEAAYVRTDVTSADSVGTMLATAKQRFAAADVLVNNAAMFASLDRKPFQDIATDEWDAVMGVNVRGPFICTKAAAPEMIARGHGKIVNIASGTVFKGMAGMLHYVTSKGAIVAMTRCLARELGSHGICVNAIAPGLTMSEGVLENPVWQGNASQATVASRAIRREQTPADLIGALLFLSSGDSDFVTGQTLVVDGGAVMN